MLIQAFTSKKVVLPLVSALFAAVSVPMALDGSGSWWWVAAWTLGAIGALAQKPPLRRRPAVFNVLQLSDTGITRRFGKEGGVETVEQVEWDDVQRIWIETTDAGPWGDDFYFVIAGSGSRGVAVSDTVATPHNLLGQLQARFPGFDNRRFIEACGCTDNRIFLMWERVADLTVPDTL